MAQWLTIDIEPGTGRRARRDLSTVEGNWRGSVRRIDEVAAAADALAFRLDHIEREQRRERGIDCASALAQHLGAGFGGTRVGCADHAGHARQRGGMGDGNFGDCGGAGCDEQSGDECE